MSSLKIHISPERLRMVMFHFAAWIPEYKERFTRAAEQWTLGAIIEFKPKRRRRTESQNNRYWAIVGELGAYAGLEKEEMHREVLCEYHGYDLKETPWGTVVKVPRDRSKDLTTTEFSDLMDIADRWAAEAGIAPPPV